MRAALSGVAAILVATVMATAACGDDPAEPAAPSAPPTTAALPPTAASPSASSSVDAQIEFCADLNAFSAAAGPAFDLGAIALIDGETPNERKNVGIAVDSIALHGALIEPRLPTELRDDVRTVVLAASQAKTKLAAGAPADDAVNLLQTDKVKAARTAVAAYRGSC